MERKGYAFFVDLYFENIPDFCTNCRKIGHHINICKILHKSETLNVTAAQKRVDKEPMKEFVQVHDGRKKRRERGEFKQQGQDCCAAAREHISQQFTEIEQI